MGLVLVIQRVERIVLLGFVFVLILTALPPTLFANSEQSDWFKGKPEIHNPFKIGTKLPPYSINGNRDCVMQKVITRPRKVLPFAPYLQSELSHESCIVNTGYGAVSQTGYLQTAGSTTFGRVTYPNGASMTLLPAPRSPMALYIYSNPPNGVSVHMIQDFISAIDSTVDSFGQVTYRVKPGTSYTSLRNNAGNIVGLKSESVSFSTGGKWMVADIPYVGLARIDTTSLAMKVFDTSFNYNVGSEPGVQSAITANGRYVVAGSRSHTQLRLYDLQSCPSSTSCRYKDLWQHFKDEIPGFTGMARMRFGSDYSLKMYVNDTQNTLRNTTRIVLAAAGHKPANFGYLGMGDSFAAGEGAYQYKAITDSGPNKCHLSQRSYPYLIADELGINDMESVACSGAVINDINYLSGDYKGQVKDNIKREDRDDVPILSGFLPGYIAQIEHLHERKPNFITISAGGNDIGFADKILRCLEPDTCYTSYEDRLEIVRETNRQFDRLVAMYEDIKNEMEGKKVFVLGYPSVAAEDGNCAQNVKLNKEEIKFANQLLRHLNSVVKAATEKVGFFYVDVSEAFYGHRLCETDSSNIAVNGITAGNDIINLPFTDFGGPIGNESFHPNALGHQLYKEAVLDKTNNLTAEMPTPNPSASYPEESDNIEILENRPRVNRPVRTALYAYDLGSDVVLRGKLWKGAVNTSKTFLKGTQNSVEVWLHSEPRLLGTFTPDSGSLEFEVEIPESTPPGYHTIHVQGTNLAGELVDIQKVIYVAASEDDTDGDGIPNSVDNCGYGEASGIDYDQDGIDDACDGWVGEPSAEAPDSGKPPENNPETVAGNEPLINNPDTNTLAQASVVSSGDRPASTYATSPYHQITPDTSTPQVAAATDSSVAPLERQILNNPSQQTNSWLVFLIFGTSLPFALFVAMKRLYS